MQSSTDALYRAEQAIIEAAENHLPHAALYLFGSRARRSAGRRSDFDLAIVPREGFSERERLEFSEALETSPEIIYSVDLIDWAEASKELKDRIREEGKLWKS